ncbi:uncharacterized protein Z518_07558 [Rhinocladiella mackenziei CBS 650.93]|uniref:Uncharacterized protein n=1 Tax=Rhinocladiella mackenziei CBS 650.93 TaxID=1442369 RepID=A0A0D2J4V4_9EURO|nr:uncharacterized protein Z518_07558 [Rhinocladiella mackenziei CBS 650.93]KIX04005.1 hypothetical protein Z518_07558 [Rhinocladiella mackenziei CBS 650.93]
MGCGVSSLKGDAVPDLNSNPTTAPAPIKKIRTNFSTIDYEQGSRQRRMTEYAPHETPKPKTSDDMTGGPLLGRAVGSLLQNDHDAANPSGGNMDAPSSGYPHEGAGSNSEPAQANGNPDMLLKPYQTLDGGDWDEDVNNEAPQVNGTQADPTSSLAKDEFAASNDPANPRNQESEQLSGPSDTTTSEHKKSWFGQKYASFQAAKQGRGSAHLSDEEIKKYTGKDRAELRRWAETAPGVGGNQVAGRIGTDSAQGMSAPYSGN